jgi:hypothetical protein
MSYLFIKICFTDKSLFYFHKKFKILRFFRWFLGFFGWVFYCQPCDKEPDIEWWDQLVLGAHNYEGWKIREGAISNLIEHPIQLQPLESTKPVHIPMFLTKKEMKKMRRQNRRETWKEKQDKIRQEEKGIVHGFN